MLHRWDCQIHLLGSEIISSEVKLVNWKNIWTLLYAFLSKLLKHFQRLSQKHRPKGKRQMLQEEYYCIKCWQLLQILQVKCKHSWLLFLLNQLQVCLILVKLVYVFSCVSSVRARYQNTWTTQLNLLPIPVAKVWKKILEKEKKAKHVKIILLNSNFNRNRIVNSKKIYPQKFFN